MYIIIVFFLSNKKSCLSLFCFGYFPENCVLVLIKHYNKFKFIIITIIIIIAIIKSENSRTACSH